MKLVLLGTGGYHPSDQRQTACVMLPELGVVLDAGTATYRVRDYLMTSTLDFFLTHAHLDHVIGLTYLFDVVRARSVRQLVVHASPEVIPHIENHLFASGLFPVRPAFQLQPLTGTVTLKDEGRLSWFPLHHPGGALGFRIDWAHRSLAYVTDTTASIQADYVRSIRDVDVLIHECYFADGFEQEAETTGHSSATPVAEVARAANVGRLILVHVNPLADESDPIGIESMHRIFPSTEVAFDRMELEF